MENITTQVAEVAAQIELINLEDKLTIKALAEKLNLIVQPVVILGARHVFDSKKLLAHSGDVHVIYLDPIDPSQDPNWFATLHTTMKERLALELANHSSHR